MREVEISDKKILLLRTFDGQWHALDPNCPHAGAPLAKGALCATRLICPWHKSCFAASDGALLEPPSLESLRSYSLEITGNEIRVHLEHPIKQQNVPLAAEVSSRPNQTFVILGGGAAAAAAVQQLRSLGFGGRLVMVSQEQWAPYDRTLLSKMYLSGQADSKQLPLHPDTLLKDCRVELVMAEIDCVHSKKRSISFKNGLSPLRYDEVLVATGGKPKLLRFPGSNSDPLVLRDVEDANRLIEAAGEAKNAVLVGASFISMEIASAFRERGLSVTVVSQDNIPLSKQLGPRMGQLLFEKHLQKGVHFIPGTNVLAIRKNGTRSVLQLSNGEELTADLVVSGIGIQPATAFLKGVPRNADGSLCVDAFMRVSGAEHMFAAGDLADFPLPNTGRRTRIEHWRVAQEQARTAAASMMGLEQPYRGVPYFWTYHYGVRYEFFGQIPGQSELSIDGDVNQSKFIAAYLNKDRCEAVFAANRESETARIFDHMKHQGPPSIRIFQQILHAGS